MKQLVFLVLFATSCRSLKLPSYVTPCSRNDPELNKCVLEQGRSSLAKMMKQGGDRKYNIPNLTPLLVTQIHTNQNGLNLTFNNVKLVGLEDSILTRVNVDLKGRREEFEFIVPSLQLICDYEVTGRILLLPIRGMGPANITLPNLRVLVSHDYDLRKGKTGKDHLVTKNPTLVLLGTPNGHIQLDNLFGNKELSDNMNLVLNDNSVEVIKDVGPAVAQAFGLAIHQIFDGITALVPFEDVYPNKV